MSSSRDPQNSSTNTLFRREDVSINVNSDDNNNTIQHGNLKRRNSESTNNHDPILYKKKLMNLEEINSTKFQPEMAFSYNFISGMHHLNRFVDGKLNYKLAGEALDAATKLYSAKVNIVYKQTNKLLKTFKQSETAQIQNVEKKKSKTFIAQENQNSLKKYCRKHICENGKDESILNGKAHKNKPIDPFYNRLSSAYDVSNIAVLASRQMDLLPNGVFSMNSNDGFSFNNSNISVSKMDKFPFPLKTNFIESVHPAFRNFDFNDRSQDMEQTVDDYISLRKAALDQRKQEEQANDADDSHCEYIPLSPIRDVQAKENQSDDDELNEFELQEDFVVPIFEDSDEPIEYGHILEQMSMANSFGADDFHSDGCDVNNNDIEGIINQPGCSKQNANFRLGTPFNIIQKAEFMMNIFNDKKLVSKNFLKKLFFKVQPLNRPKIFHEPIQLQSVELNKKRSQSLTIKKSRVRKVTPLLDLSFKIPRLDNPYKESLSKTAITKSVQKREKAVLQNRFVPSNDNSLSAFWNSKIVFIPITVNNASNANDPAEDDFNFDELEPDDLFGQQEMNLSLNDSFNLVMPTNTQPSQPATSAWNSQPTTGTFKSWRFITDFGDNFDPFNLGEQNYEIKLMTSANEDLEQMNENCLDYHTKMKKINIKKLKKRMFFFCENHKITKSELEEYQRVNGEAPKNCLTFYKLIYYIIYHGNFDEKTLEDLTVQNFFVAVLHLCNDKGLHLIKCNGESGDFYIVFL